ncbi:hypothetical protein VRU48_09045 [Pedobacter sp. KR3-3]|uniref:Uncharacterized protein n=1 Tax=Pedobacter albus TaxID=3113905 RepID=A0ABU7I6Z8_9SPHI|nr:hypothetical protein [Pedobacter sp. KR3-3]MEE1945253.1 hypothetical protein [Pedobacter sp. KR3-3]
MKKIFTLLSALLIVTGVKAQKANVQKETVKPKADTLVKSIDKQSNNAPAKKDAKIAPAIKYAPVSKVAPAAAKTAKIAPVH